MQLQNIEQVRCFQNLQNFIIKTENIIKKSQKRNPFQQTMQDFKIEKYEFIITPCEITTVPITQNKKSIVIKLGQTMGRCTELFKPMALTTEVLYSISNDKYCPIKGIIKVYDRVDQYNQIISCIGSFQVEEILHLKLKRQTVQKNIGSTTIKMDIQVKQVKDREKQSISCSNSSLSGVSSQNLRESLQKNTSNVNQGHISEQLQKLGGIRRVHTLNLQPLYNTNDITDLKNGINLGFSKQIPIISPKSQQSSKLQEKALTLHKSANKQEPSLNGSSIKQQEDRIPSKLEYKPSLDCQLKEIDTNLNYPDVEKVQSSVMLEIQSNPSNDIQLSHHSQALGQPNLAFPPISDSLNNKRLLTSSGIEEVKSMSMVDSKEDNNHISNSINLTISSNAKQIPEGLKKSLFSKYQKFQQGQRFPTPGFRVNGELQNSGASITNSLASLQEYQKIEIQTLGELLVEQRRKNLFHEDKIQKLQLKLITSKQKYMEIYQQWAKWREAAYHFVQHLHRDANGNYIVEEIKGKDLIALKYEITEESQEIFTNFLAITVDNCDFGTQIRNPYLSQLTVPKRKVESENSDLSTHELDKVLQKIQYTYSSNTKLQQTNKKYESTINQLQAKLRKAEADTQELNKQKTKTLETCKYLQRQVGYLQAQVKSLLGINAFLKQKEARMQNIVNLKEETIAHLKKKMEQNNAQLDKLEQDIESCKKTAQNKELMLEQMREELADKEETIQAYKQSFGQVSKIKKGRDRVDRDIITYIESILHADS